MFEIDYILNKRVFNTIKLRIRIEWTVPVLEWIIESVFA